MGGQSIAITHDDLALSPAYMTHYETAGIAHPRRLQTSISALDISVKPNVTKITIEIFEAS
jgi:hypothetical protein